MIEEAAQAYMKAGRTIVVYGMDITQHHHGAKAVQQLANLCLLRGEISAADFLPGWASGSVPRRRRWRATTSSARCK